MTPVKILISSVFFAVILTVITSANGKSETFMGLKELSRSRFRRSFPCYKNCLKPAASGRSQIKPFVPKERDFYIRGNTNGPLSHKRDKASDRYVRMLLAEYKKSHNVPMELVGEVKTYREPETNDIEQSMMSWKYSMRP